MYINKNIKPDIIFENDDGSIIVINKEMPDNSYIMNNFIEFIDDIYNDTFIRIEENINNNETKLYIGENDKLPLTFNLLLGIKEKEYIYKHNLYANKLKSKAEAKKLINNKYKIGDILSLRSKIKDGSARVEKIFEVKKVIWSVKNNPVNVLILKQLSGINTNRSLTRTDCLKYHIKYEPGLQVYSMMTNFSKRKRLNK